MAKRCIAAGGRTIGVIVHGARSVSEASEVFSRLARTAERHLGRTLRSYGLLVDDLHVYRSIVSRRPIGLTHPHSPAAKALRDVARWIAEDISRGELG
jgi:MinD-like ATPase involved in chromosome partitioning or flagellar assembly